MSELTKLLEGVKVEWKTLEEVCNVLNGFAFASKNFNNDKIGLPLIRIRDVNTGFSNTYYSGNYDTKFIVENGDILIGMDGDFRVAKWHHGRALLNQRVCRLQDFKDFINPQFVYYIIRDELLRIHKKIESTTVKHLSSRELYKCLIPIPCPDNPEKSLKIQQEIVRILDSLSEETNQVTAALQKELVLHQKQYNFYREELFKFEGKEVEWKSLGEIAEIGTGSRNTNEAVIDGEYPFFVRSQIPRKINEFEFDETAIITAGDGVGVGKVFHFVNGKYALHQRAYRIVVKSNKVNPKFLFYYIKSNFSKYVEKNSVFASVTSLRKPMFDKYPVPVASFEEQERIIKLLHDLDFTTNSIIAEIQKEIELRNKQYEYYRDHLLSFHSLQTISSPSLRAEGEAIQKNTTTQ